MSHAFSGMDEQDYDEMRHAAQWQRRYAQQLMAHPDCRAPDHPGCESCWPNEENEGYEL